ncbi:hypothetical protein BC939DRAFT_443284 [Gamsiella multidivaricata]|uniref:uncharacterized protein n=1 Tax=Gamsiella multidivaricata TaxID=101098 RepID=UPI00221F8BB1|nr:uncharacterized protein BC939DRAFT_443284 [Gamsiella multidivaricata]KAI7828571.1 hypothetical protein BC939DRAFT_443284 [Gamsiella multidivaricata]
MTSQREQVVHWLQGNDLLLGNLQLLNLSGNSVDSVISQPFFVGTNTSNPGSDGVELFRNPKNHVDATSSVLTFAGNQTNFHPAWQDMTTASRNYSAYVNKIGSFPGFILTLNDQPQPYRSSYDPMRMISDIMSAYSGVIDVDVQQVISSIIRMANSVLSSSSADASKSLFNQMAVQKDPSSDTVRISIFYTILHMRKETSGKDTYVSQEYTINRAAFRVDGSVLVENAEVLAQMVSKTPIRDWLNANSSPTNASIRSCFEEYFNKEIP